MNITCPHCKARLNIPDHKLPRGKEASFKCPKCRETVQVPSREGAAPVAGAQALSSGRGGKAALICMGEGPVRGKAVQMVEQKGFRPEICTTLAQAFKKMSYHIYPLVLVDDAFDPDRGGVNAMIRHMNGLDMSLRRRICLVQVSPDIASGDPAAALCASVNFIINPRDLGQGEELLAAAVLEHANFYQVYNDSMKAAGKA